MGSRNVLDEILDQLDLSAIIDLATSTPRADTEESFDSRQDATQAKNEERAGVLRIEERASRAGFRPDQASTGIWTVPFEGIR